MDSGKQPTVRVGLKDKFLILSQRALIKPAWQSLQPRESDARCYNAGNPQGRTGVKWRWKPYQERWLTTALAPQRAASPTNY
ncbi:hypothetical protein [Chlorogloeopsis sp. ULAP02]|uniref:hypothetical protein n=1 Tax=Chlorogloeopsis sp. ULAP02 TaxID=3107926 RepID=UPI0031367671